MTKSRAELSPLLTLLEGMMPNLIEAHPVESDFAAAVTREADIIKVDSDPADHPWLHAQICYVLDDFGRQHDGYPPLPDILPA